MIKELHHNTGMWVLVLVVLGTLWIIGSLPIIIKIMVFYVDGRFLGGWKIIL